MRTSAARYGPSTPEFDCRPFLRREDEAHSKRIDRIPLRPIKRVRTSAEPVPAAAILIPEQHRYSVQIYRFLSASFMRHRNFLFIVFMLSISHAAPARADQQTVAGPPQITGEQTAIYEADSGIGEDPAISPAMMMRIRTFLDGFVDPGKTPEQQTAFFADQVEYYDRGIVGKSVILRDVERFVRHWPVRNYRVVEIDYIRRDPDSDRIYVSYTIEFAVANRSKSIRGRANYGALIGGLDDTPKIESIKEKVTRRTSDTSQLD
jgi:hypothetical protein